MKEPHQFPSGPEWNPPVVMALRLGGVLAMLLFLGGLGLLTAGVHGRSLPWTALGLGGMATASVAVRWLWRRRDEAGLLNWMEMEFPGDGPPKPAEARGLEVELREMERKRGTQDFDPWRFLELRRQLDALRRTPPTRLR